MKKNEKNTNIIDDLRPESICRHKLDFTVTITLRMYSLMFFPVCIQELFSLGQHLLDFAQTPLDLLVIFDTPSLPLRQADFFIGHLFLYFGKSVFITPRNTKSTFKCFMSESCSIKRYRSCSNNLYYPFI